MMSAELGGFDAYSRIGATTIPILRDEMTECDEGSSYG